jgi:hypothetical protein
MTWIAYCTVKSVDNATAYLEGVAGTQVHPWRAQSSDLQTDAVVSNTEGTILRVRLEMEFDERAPLSIGDLVMVNGSFSRQPAQTPVEFR